VHGFSYGSSADALGISESSFTLLRDLIEERLGIFFDNGKRDLLADKLAQLIVNYGFQSFLDYYYALKYDEESDRYWSELMDRLTVPETYFWRQPEQFKVLARNVVPRHLSESGRSIRIWSGACCSGEEPLSIAMALAVENLFPHRKIDIIASDASPAMIERARQGLYPERSFRNLPFGWRERFFDKQGNQWKAKAEIHSQITWHVVNLLDDAQVQAMPPVDVVFCRNVLIYFSDPAIERLATSLAHKLPLNGKLFLGAAESLTRLKTSFTLDQIEDAFVYINRHNSKRINDANN
jgi:chemotaxis protein methyltransferase CheR